MYLVTIHEGQKQYQVVNFSQEKKITEMMRTGDIPARFTLNEKQVISEEILGFTDHVEPEQRPQSVTPKFQNWDEFREWAKEQAWYRKGRKDVSADTSPPPAPSEPQSSLSFPDAA